MDRQIGARSLGLTLVAALVMMPAPTGRAAPQVGADTSNSQVASAHWLIRSDDRPWFVSAGAVKVTNYKGGTQSFAYAGKTLCDLESHGRTVDVDCRLRTRLVFIPNRYFQADRLLRQASLTIPVDGPDHTVMWRSRDDPAGTFLRTSIDRRIFGADTGAYRPQRASGRVFGLRLAEGIRNGRLEQEISAAIFVRGVYRGAPVVIRFHRTF